MHKRASIEIENVGNGWIVRPTVCGPGVYLNSDIFVFETIDAMKVWLAEHFEVVPVPLQEKQPLTAPEAARECEQRMQGSITAVAYIPHELMTATEVVRRNEEHLAGIERQREQFAPAARQRYLNAFGAEAMSEAEARVRGG